MISMYSMMNSVYGMSALNSMMSNTGNVHQSLKMKYGVGYEDFGQKPYAHPYPFGVVPLIEEPKTFKNFLQKITYKLYS